MVTGLRPELGDDAMASALAEILPTLGIPPEKTVVISGARAPAIATGIRVNRADLSVWVVISDEDALAFGGGHIIHALRRNVSLKIVLLSAGAFDVVSLALAAGATFAARALDGHREQLTEMLAAAAAHDGAALVEVRHVCGHVGGGTPPPETDAARIPVGVFRSVRRETFDELFRQRSVARGDLQQLLVSDDYH